MMERRIVKRGGIFLALACLVFFGCGKGGEEQHRPAKAMTKAIAVLYPTEGNKAQGVVAFTKERKGLHIQARIEGLTPGPHGIHIHEYGDCSSPDASSAGGHLNPGKAPHASPTDKKHHLGDMGNIEADSTGVATLDMQAGQMSFDGPNSIIGRSVVVHLLRDDFSTQPAGNAGARVACGAIGFAK